MQQRPQVTRQLTSAPFLGTKERSAPASTYSSYVFRPQSDLLDCCGDQLFAFERDVKRFATLRSMVTKAGCRNVELTNADFLASQYDDRKYANVTHM